MACTSTPSFPHLGTSPDGIMQCTCCGKGVFEIKCPYNAKEYIISDAVKVNLIDNTTWILSEAFLFVLLSDTNSTLHMQQCMLTWLFGQPKIVLLKGSLPNMTSSLKRL